MILYALSFCANTVITLSVAAAIRCEAPGITEAFGPDTTARRILACMYIAIGLLSIYALIQMTFGNREVAAAIGMTLFPLQILYKLAAAVAIGLQNVVVRANIAVAAFLALTLLFGS